MFVTSSASGASPFPVAKVLAFSLAYLVVSRSTLPRWCYSLILPYVTVTLVPRSSTVLTVSATFVRMSSRPFLVLEMANFSRFPAATFGALTTGSKFFGETSPSPFFAALNTKRPVFVSGVSFKCRFGVFTTPPVCSKSRPGVYVTAKYSSSSVFGVFLMF